MVSSLENKIDDTEKKYAETSKLSEDYIYDNEVINRLASENQQLKVRCLIAGHICGTSCFVCFLEAN